MVQRFVRLLGHSLELPVPERISFWVKLHEERSCHHGYKVGPNGIKHSWSLWIPVVTIWKSVRYLSPSFVHVLFVLEVSTQAFGEIHLPGWPFPVVKSVVTGALSADRLGSVNRPYQLYVFISFGPTQIGSCEESWYPIPSLSRAEPSNFRLKRPQK